MRGAKSPDTCATTINAGARGFSCLPYNRQKEHFLPLGQEGRTGEAARRGQGKARIVFHVYKTALIRADNSISLGQAGLDIDKQRGVIAV